MQLILAYDRRLHLRTAVQWITQPWDKSLSPRPVRHRAQTGGFAIGAVGASIASSPTAVRATELKAFVGRISILVGMIWRPSQLDWWSVAGYWIRYSSRPQILILGYLVVGGQYLLEGGTKSSQYLAIQPSTRLATPMAYWVGHHSCGLAGDWKSIPRRVSGPVHLVPIRYGDHSKAPILNALRPHREQSNSPLPTSKHTQITSRANYSDIATTPCRSFIRPHEFKLNHIPRRTYLVARAGQINLAPWIHLGFRVAHHGHSTGAAYEQRICKNYKKMACGYSFWIHCSWSLRPSQGFWSAMLRWMGASSQIWYVLTPSATANILTLNLASPDTLEHRPLLSRTSSLFHHWPF